MPTDPDAYLSALDDLRSERDHLHPHRPLLDPLSTADPTPARSPLDEDLIALGRRRLAEMRALIDAQIERLRGVGP